MRFDGQTVIVTGAGAGLGRAYALMYGKLGANVVVNDVNEKGANAVVNEVVKGNVELFLIFPNLTCHLAGGKAAAAVCSVEDAEKIVQIALEKFGGVHILIANAGILRDKSFQAMTEQEWDLVLAVHLRWVSRFIFPRSFNVLILVYSGTYKVLFISSCHESFSQLTSIS